MKTSIKKVMAIVLTITMLVGMAGVATSSGKWKTIKVYEDPTISFFKNNQKVNLDKATLAINGSTYLPVRSLAEVLGIDIRWSDQERAVYLTDGSAIVNQAATANYIKTISDQKKENESLKQKVKNLEASEKKLKDEIEALKKKTSSNRPDDRRYDDSWYRNALRYETEIQDSINDYNDGKDKYSFFVKIRDRYYDRNRDYRDDDRDRYGRDDDRYGYGRRDLYIEKSNGDIYEYYSRKFVDGAYARNGYVYNSDKEKIGILYDYRNDYNDRWYDRDRGYGFNEIELIGANKKANYSNIDTKSKDFIKYIEDVAKATKRVTGEYPKRIIVKNYSEKRLETYTIDSRGNVE